jgi:hypothetical protein
MHKTNLEVLTANNDDVYRDVARVPQKHRGAIKEGTLCKISCGSRAAFLAVRGSQNHSDATIKLDEKTRIELGIELAKSYDFSIMPLNFCGQYRALWHASDPHDRFAMRLSLISFALGIIGIVLGVVSVVPMFRG